MAKSKPTTKSAAPKAASGLEQMQEEKASRLRICAQLAAAGVTIVDPETTYIDLEVSVEPGTILRPNTTISGQTRIGERCDIGPNAILADCTVDQGCRIVASVVEGAVLEEKVDVGPFSHLRAGAYLEAEVHVGNYVEITRSRLGRGSKVGHFSYLGDAQVGAEVNIGAGTVTCNYDGQQKNETIIEDNVFIGSGTMLVAPVKVGRGAITGAGSVVTKDVAAGTTVAGVPARQMTKVRSRPAQPGPARPRRQSG